MSDGTTVGGMAWRERMHERLHERLHERMTEHVEAGDVPGVVALVVRGERAGAAREPHVVAIGSLAMGISPPMRRDSVFRLASITKPIAAAAAMLLVDDGTLRIDDAVDEWLPELANRRVLRSLQAELDDTVPAVRAITVEDLLTFRLGFGSIMAAPGSYPIQAEEERLELRTLGPPWPPAGLSSDEWLRRFATLPLLHQPGEGWRYNTGAQVLGVLIERAAGMPLEAFMRERLFDPLGMHDTAFSLRPGQRERLTTAYVPDPVSGRLALLDPVLGSWWSEPPAMANAAGWLLSTVDDVWSFARLLLDDGVRDGERLLSVAAVRAMTTNHLPASQLDDAQSFVGAGAGWGYCMEAPLDSGRVGGAGAAVPGGFGWDGGTGTSWRSDRAAGVTGILLTQRAMTSSSPTDVAADFWSCVYAAGGG